MESVLAIYEALIQANVSQPAARRVAEALERDMTYKLATRQDLQHLGELTSARFDALEKRLDARFAVQDDLLKLKMEGMESRLVIKLGVLMTVLFGASGAILALIR